MISLHEIKGLREMLEAAREDDTATREDAWLGITRVIAGRRVRVMTVRDYTFLLQFHSPLLNRRLPTPTELSFFLWLLSPEVEAWYSVARSGFRISNWRTWPCLRWVQSREAKRHGLAVRRHLKLDELEELERQWRVKSKLPFELPDAAPFTLAVKECFGYVDELFLDRPPGLRKEGPRAGLCYLTSWFDLLQSEYKLATEEVWAMELPILFSRIKAIQSRRNANVPEFSEVRDKILQNLMQGLRKKLYTEEDLRAGKVDLERNCLRNN